jgi:3-hydroxyisobutyrate dehydrogenase-like beta-hydroxyacid dehydrogenase
MHTFDCSSDFVVGIIGLGDMGKMYARRLSEAGWKYGPPKHSRWAQDFMVSTFLSSIIPEYDELECIWLDVSSSAGLIAFLVPGSAVDFH